MAGERLKTREYVGYALGDTASNFFFQTFNIFLTYYYVDVWGIPRHFRRVSLSLPIIAISGNARANALDVSKQLGVVAVLEKPFALEELLRVVSGVLKK